MSQISKYQFISKHTLFFYLLLIVADQGKWVRIGGWSFDNFILAAPDSYSNFFFTIPNEFLYCL